MSQNLDYEFDQYLKRRENEIVKTIPAFHENLEQSGFRYGRFTIPTFYKSFFLTPKQLHLVKRVSTAVMQIVNKVAREYFEGGYLSEMFRVPEEARELIRIDPGFSESVVISRFNSLLEGESLKLLELNCDSPVGAGYGSHVEDFFVKEGALQEFFQNYHFIRSEQIQALLGALLAVYEEFGGFETPNICIMEWRFTRTAMESKMIKEVFESKGYKTVIADPRELTFKGGKLYHKSMKIHLVYRRTLFDEILEHLDEVGDLIKAYRSKAVCMVNPLRSRIACSKALLSVLTNPQFEHLFTENENRIEREHIPWTRHMEDAGDFYGHRKVYLIDFLKDEKESLVLKPSVSYGGRGVAIGRETREDDWNETIGKAVKGDWVVQEYVNVPIMTVPKLITGKLDFAYKKHNFNILVFGGKYAGGFTRLSDESVINVARGGGLIPALASESPAERFSG